jgi:hypothetical protein
MGRLLIIRSLLLIVLAGGILDAEEQDFWSRSHFYLCGLLAYNNVLGDFKGDTFLSGVGQVCIIPQVGYGYGYGGLVGVREKSTAFELSYTRSAHTGLWAGANFESQLEIWGIDLRAFLFRLPPFELFALFGGCVPILTVFQGASDGFVIGDAKYRGFGLDIGAGVSFLLGNHFSLVAQAVYHGVFYSSVEGTDQISRDITDDLMGNGFDFNALLLVTL